MSADQSSDGREAPEHAVGEAIPGIALLTVSAVFSWLVAPVVPGLNAILVAVLVGFVLSNAFGLPAWAVPGVSSHKVFLGAAIVLMGCSVTVDTVTDSGLVLLVAVVSVSSLTLVLVELSSRNLFGVDSKLSSLLAAGSSICGVSAIVAVAGSIHARDEHVVYAATTILVFDAVTLVLYPMIGELFSISDKVFGVWAGVSMFSTGPVIAVGFAYSETAGQWATLTKLTRNALIGVVAVGYATYYARRRIATDGDRESAMRLRELWDRFPKFIAGFVILMLFASVGLLTPQHVRSLENAYNWLFLLAFVGLGTEIRLTKFSRAGIAPVLVVLSTLFVVSATSLIVLSLGLS